MLQTILVFSPALGALFAGLFGSFIGDRNAQYVTCGLMGVTAVCAWINLFANVGEPAFKVPLLQWITVGSFSVNWALRSIPLDRDDVRGRLHQLPDPRLLRGLHVPRPEHPALHGYLSLFTFSMLMLVTSDNLMQLFFGWEGVGLASYLLIGFWYTKPSACAAAIKAFIVNRVGDFGLVLGIAAAFLAFDSVQFDEIFARVPELAPRRCTPSATTLDARADRRAAVHRRHGQVGAARPAHLAARRHGRPDPGLGADPRGDDGDRRRVPGAPVLTALRVRAEGSWHGHLHRRQHRDLCRHHRAHPVRHQAGDRLLDLLAARLHVLSLRRRRLSAGIFHLYTHAFFKALLFLGAGSVIHAMSGEQDMRKMGGIWSKVKVTYAVMWIGTLALIGFPGFAGFFSKDAVLEAAWASHNDFHYYAFWMGEFAAILTAFYSGRVIWLTFHGEPRADEHTMHHVHESPPVMLIPLIVLATGAVLVGWFGRGMIDPERSSGPGRSSTASTTTSCTRCTRCRCW